MSLRTLILWIIDLAVWYLFIWYWLYSIKNPVFLPASSGVLLILGVLGVLLCPLLKHVEAWKRFSGKEDKQEQKDASKK